MYLSIFFLLDLTPTIDSPDYLHLDYRYPTVHNKQKRLLRKTIVHIPTHCYPQEKGRTPQPLPHYWCTVDSRATQQSTSGSYIFCGVVHVFNVKV